MKKRMPQQIRHMHPPTRQDRLIVLLLSVGIFLMVLPLARTIHPQVIGWIIMSIVIGLPVVLINVLLPSSHWEISSTFIDEGADCQEKRINELEENERRRASSTEGSV
jgi:hypothetical protein